MMHPDHAINSVCLTLVNEGALYELHKDSAYRPLRWWRQHVLTSYRYHHTVLRGDKALIAGEILRDYYHDHVTEDFN